MLCSPRAVARALVCCAIALTACGDVDLAQTLIAGSDSGSVADAGPGQDTQGKNPDEVYLDTGVPSDAVPHATPADIAMPDTAMSDTAIPDTAPACVNSGQSIVAVAAGHQVRNLEAFRISNKNALMIDTTSTTGGADEVRVLFVSAGFNVIPGFTVALPSGSAPPRVAVSGATGLIVWSDQNTLHGRRFNDTGSSTPFSLTASGGAIDAIDVARAPNDGFIVGWAQEGGPTTPESFSVAMIDAAGSVTAEHQIATAAQIGEVAVEVRSDQVVAAAWTALSQTYLHVFDQPGFGPISNGFYDAIYDSMFFGGGTGLRTEVNGEVIMAVVKEQTLMHKNFSAGGTSGSSGAAGLLPRDQQMALCGGYFAATYAVQVAGEHRAINRMLSAWEDAGTEIPVPILPNLIGVAKQVHLACPGTTVTHPSQSCAGSDALLVWIEDGQVVGKLISALPSP